MDKVKQRNEDRELASKRLGGKKMTETESLEGKSAASPVCTGSKRVVHLTIVHHPFDPRIFHKQLQSLGNVGFDVHLIAPHTRTECRDGVTIHSLPEPANRAERLALQPKAFRRARFLDADLYQIHDPELLPLAGLLKKSTGAVVVYDMHEDYRTKGAVLGRGLRALERWSFRWVDHVFLAEKSYRPIVKGREVPHTYIPNYVKPVGTSTKTPVGATREDSVSPTHLLYTGTVAEKRGLGTMIDLATKIRRANRPEMLTIVGICRHADQRAAAEAQVRHEDLQGVIDRVGWDTYVPPSTMSPYYRRADVGLALCEPHPNLVDSLLTKFYEYLQYGLPIICSDFPLWRDFIEENECGAVVPPGNARAVLEVLTQWQNQPEMYREHVRKARTAADRYRWGNVEDRLVQVYRYLLSPT